MKSQTHISTLTKKNNDEDSKFEVGDHVKISTCKNNFAKGYTAKWSEEVFMVRKVKSTVSWASLVILIVNKLSEPLMIKNRKKKTKSV